MGPYLGVRILGLDEQLDALDGRRGGLGDGAGDATLFSWREGDAVISRVVGVVWGSRARSVLPIDRSEVPSAAPKISHVRPVQLSAVPRMGKIRAKALARCARFAGVPGAPGTGNGRFVWWGIHHARRPSRPGCSRSARAHYSQSRDPSGTQTWRTPS